METFFGILLMIGLCAFCWLVVFSKHVRGLLRRRRRGPVELDYHESEEEWLERQDALTQGIATIPAVLFSILLLIGVALSVAGLFG